MKDFFKLKKDITVFSVGACIVSAVAFLICVYIGQKMTIEVSLSPESHENMVNIIAHLELLKNFMLVVFSIILTNLLSAIFIEGKNKNGVYKEIVGSVVGDGEFFRDRKREDNEETLELLEKMLVHKGNEIAVQLYDRMRDELPNFIKEKYYYEYVNINIKCNIENDCFVKDVQMVKCIKPIDEKIEFKKETFVLTNLWWLMQKVQQ